MTGAAGTALAIPELLLHILELAHFDHPAIRRAELARYALVSTKWTGPAQQSLYRSIEIIWRFSKAIKLLRTLRVLNSSLGGLVNSCSIQAFDSHDLGVQLMADFDGEGFARERGLSFETIEWMDMKELMMEEIEKQTLEHEDQIWFGGEGDRAMVQFLELLPNLKVLQISNLGRLGVTHQVPMSSACAEVLRGLRELSLPRSCGLFSTQILNSSSNIVSLDLPSNVQLPTHLITTLRHLLISERVVSKSWEDQTIIFSSCHQSIQTLSIRAWDSRVPSLDGVNLVALTHLQLRHHHPHESQITAMKAMLPCMPNLVHLRIDPEEVLLPILPFLSSSITSIESLIRADTKLSSMVDPILASKLTRHTSLKSIKLIFGLPRRSRLGDKVVSDTTEWVGKAKDQDIDLCFGYLGETVDSSWMSSKALVQRWAKDLRERVP